MSYWNRLDVNSNATSTELRAARESAEPGLPTTEDEALTAYKRASALVPELWDRKTMKTLEAHAEQHGWTALADHKAERQRRADAHRDRQAITQRDADERAAQLTHRRDAIELYERALRNDDNQLAQAIQRTAKNKGWNLMTKNTDDLAMQAHINMMTILGQHDAASASYRDALRAGKVTPEYVTELLNDGTTPLREQLEQITAESIAFVDEAQADYDSILIGLTAPTGDINQQLLDEIRAGKEWDRIQRELDALPREKRSFAMVDRITAAKGNTLRTLMAEAPSYLTALGVNDADTLVRSAVHEGNPDLKEAQAQIIAASKLRDLTSHNARLIANRLSTASREDIGREGLDGYVDPTRYNA